jgi:gliding motility-associated-like protein
MMKITTTFLKIMILFIMFLPSSFFSQNNIPITQDDKILYAEKALKVFFGNPINANNFQSEFNLSIFEFRVKNRSFLSDITEEVITQYKNDAFDLDTLESFFYNKIEINKNDLNLGKDPFGGLEDIPIPQLRGPGDPCTNMDFEDGNLNGWEMFEGNVNNTPYVMVGANQIGAPGAHHTIMAAGGNDPVVGIPVVNPNGGGNFSLRLGDGTGTGSRAASVRQTFLVDANNAAFVYSYAVVLQNPGHTAGDQPFFKINMYDQNGGTISCGEYEVIPSSGANTDWVVQGGVEYLPWRTTFAPLDAYIGQNVTIEFLVGDCAQSGHYGYAYVDAECTPLQLIPPGFMICSNDPVTLEAPAGAVSYNWNTGETSQSISTNVPGTYTVTVVPVTGATCSIDIEAIVDGSVDIPIADFTALPTSVCVGEAVSFTDISTTNTGVPVTFWEWNLDDGSQDFVQNTSHSYSSPGNYNVSLVAGVNGCFDTITYPIEVFAIPTADFSVNAVCQGQNTQFNDLSNGNGSPINSWQWDFTNNGTIDNTFQNPSHIYPNATSTNATLIVSNANGCADTVSYPVVVNPFPAASFMVNDACQGVLTQFSNQSTISAGTITGFQWDFGDLIGSSASENTSYTYANSGNYDVVLTITSDNGCIHSVTNEVNIFDNPVASFTYSEACDGFPLNFINTSNGNGGVINTFEWDFNNDGIVDYSGNSTDYTFPAQGVYDVTLFVSTINGCEDQITQSVTLHPSPTLAFTSQNVCEGNDVSFTNNSFIGAGAITDYEWDFGNGFTSTSENPVQTYNNQGVYQVSLTVTTDQGCIQSLQQPVEIYPTPLAQFITSDVCEGSQASFTNFSTVSNANTVNNITSWNWNFGTNPPATTTGQFANYNYSDVGTYTVTLEVTTNNGCTNSTQNDITIHPNPVIDFSSPNPDGCTSWCPTFVNNSSIANGTINAYLWNLGDGTASTDAVPVHCYENNTLQNVSYTVSVTMTSDFGCTTSSTEFDMITVYPTPVADFIPNPEVANIYNTEVNFINQSLISSVYNWDFAGLGTSNEVNPSFTFSDLDSGTYLVCLDVESIYGCVNEVCKEVIIEGVANLYVPNSFTPDNDGKNDFFGPVLYGFSEEDYQFMVFDRWGLLIYETTQFGGTWNGIYRGDYCPQDVYVWKIKVKDKYTGRMVEQMGHVTLIR